MASVWREIVLKLSPSLDNLPPVVQAGLEKLDAPTGVMARKLLVCSLTASQDSLNSPLSSSPSSPLRVGPPAVLEPTPTLSTPPRHLQLGTLPTPNFTPTSSVCSTPAASLANFSQRPSAMCSAMSMANCATMARTTMDYGTSRPTFTTGLEAYRMGRRPSVQYNDWMSTSDPGSPGSMISDNSSQFSRSSSISSASSNQTSPTRSRDLARLAAFNCGQKLPESDVVILSSGPLHSSPDMDPTMQVEPADLHTPIPGAGIHGKKRHRSITSTQQTDLQSQVRGLLAPSLANQVPSIPASRFAEPRYPVQMGPKRFASVLPMQPAEHIRPSGGPGMWKGIL